MITCTCIKCSRVSVALTRAQALEEIARFNAYFDTLTPEKQAHFGGKHSTVANYRCIGCGGTRFRESKPGDCPRGVTISPVIWEANPNEHP